MSLPVRPAQLALHFVLVATALALSAGTSFSQCPGETHKWLASDGAEDDAFGISVAISGTTAIVGAYQDDDLGMNSGSAYLFDTTTGLQRAKLLPTDGAALDSFGYSVAISGTTAIVGAWLDADHGFQSGAAYLFDTTTGIQMAKLLPTDGAVQDHFGHAVAISGTTAIIGAISDDDNGSSSGSAYVFDTVTGLQLAKLLPNDGAQTDQFGFSVAISGTSAIVGARLDDDNGTNSGSAYIFDTTTGQQVAKLMPSDGAVEDQFGVSVAISGTTAIVGAVFDDDNGSFSGSAYLFNTTTGLQLAKLQPSDGMALDHFGVSVAISGATAIVGAQLDDDYGSNSGSVYAFDATTGQQVAKLMPSDGATLDYFGVSVAISGTTTVIGAYGNDDTGADSGSAYFFDNAVIAQPDCNANAICDDHEIASGIESDCNNNGVLDSCDITNGASLDCNANGIPDGCDILILDCNANGIPDTCDIATGMSIDFDQNGIPDECMSDCDRDGTPDYVEILFGAESDCNANEVPDSCELDSGASLDCDANGVPDECDIASGGTMDCNTNGIPDSCDVLVMDCNENGVPDSCDIAVGTSTDCNMNGIPDSCDLLTMDCNANGIPDSCDIANGTSVDLNQNGFPDECKPDCNTNGIPDYVDLAFGSSLDCDFNGVPDECEDCDGNGVGDACDIQGGALDCNVNGVPDVCDITSGSGGDCDGDFVPDDCQIAASPSLDRDGNGVLDSCEPSRFATFCNGDGGDQLGCTECPCSNNSPAGTVGGCLNSGGTSNSLSVTGSVSVSLPSSGTSDLRFGLSGAPANAFCILNSGDAVAPGNMANPCFGSNSGLQAAAFDGLRCAITNTRRHGGRSADASGDVGATNSPWGGEGGPNAGIAQAGVGFVSGQTRYFQVVNRDDPLLNCMRGLNTSQAIEITFTP